ncbi:MAG: hypothetical protein DID90_2727552291 [Candidatus Nitrotoga sp. LAW]|nr:MAG: hypothetical protein DID90_2727552291 [Candidatus Nitrotoga sp. LAW]
MLTFSYRENVKDEEKLKGDMHQCVCLIRNHYPDFQYVVIREFHDSEHTNQPEHEINPSTN